MSTALFRIVASATTVWTVAALSGCAPGKAPFLQVEICVHDKSGVQQFAELMHNIAKEEGMRFVDRSSITRQELENMNQITESDPKRILNIRVEDNNGIGVSAGNFGLSTYQISLGFSGGSDSLRATRFADEVIDRLRRHWNVSKISAGSGALPMKDCS